MMTLGRIENAISAARTTGDPALVEAVRMLRERLLADQAAFDAAKITRAALHYTELNVLGSISVLFPAPNGRDR